MSFDVRLDLIKVAGDIVAGVLLSRIVMLCDPAALQNSGRCVRRDGVYWLAKTGEEWMAECGFTRRGQYRRAVSVLKRKKLIEVRLMMFQGITMNHTRLLQENLEELLLG
jgi:hypothetical protein